MVLETVRRQMSKQRTWLQWAGVALFIVWLFYSLGAYFVVQKPFSLPLLTGLIEERQSWPRWHFSGAALGRSLLDIAIPFWLALVALGLGTQVLLRVLPAGDQDPPPVFHSVGLGFGVLGLVTLLMGLLGLLHTAMFFVVTVTLSLPATVGLYRQRHHLRVRRPPKLVGIYLLAASGLTLGIALLPPTSWDALFYHLTGPKLYLEAGRILPGIDVPHLNFPSLFEMMFMMAMGLRGDVAAKLLHFVFFLLLAGMVHAVAREHLQLRQGWTAVLFYFAVPMTSVLAGWAYNDLALAFYQLAALDALLRWRSNGQERWLVLSGLFCGLAMGLKYTSFVAPLFLVAVVLWDRRKQGLGSLRPAMTLAAPAVLLASPWYLKNLFFTGNPVYPFLFGGRFWDAFRSAAYADPGSGIGPDLIALLRLPHDLTLGLRDASQDGPTGPFFLVFLPLLLFYAMFRSRRAPAAFRLLLLFALVQYAFWTVGVISSAGLWQSRLLLPGLVALCPALAWILADLKRLDHPQFSLQRFLALTLGLGLLLGLVSQSIDWLSRGPFNYLLGQQPGSAYLTQQLGLHYVAMDGINNMLPRDAVVMFLWEPRTYYCQLDCRPDSILDNYARFEHLYGDAAAISAAWRRDGISHILIHEAGLNFVLDAGPKRIAPRLVSTLDELRSTYLSVVAQWGDAYTLYRIGT